MFWKGICKCIFISKTLRVVCISICLITPLMKPLLNFMFQHLFSKGHDNVFEPLVVSHHHKGNLMLHVLAHKCRGRMWCMWEMSLTTWGYHGFWSKSLEIKVYYHRSWSKFSKAQEAYEPKWEFKCVFQDVWANI